LPASFRAAQKKLDRKNVAPADGDIYIYLDLRDDNIAPGFGSVK
jgi:hypothetical protein